MKEWKTYKLSEIADIQTGPFGSQLHNNDYVDNGTPIVTVEHLGNRKFSTQNLPCVSDADKARLSKYILNEGDIVFSRVGSVDRCSYVSSDEDGWMFSGRCLRVRCNNMCNPLFLYYYFCKETIKQYIRSIAVGATMPSINTKLLSDLPITLPSIDVQDKAVQILSRLDDKIELNRQINDNLEQQAQALYKSWFVDFEPFCEEEFIETSLGSIPAGWKVGQLSDICEIVGGGTPSKSHPDYYCSRGIAWITPKDLSVSKSKFSSRGSEDITSDGYKNSSAKLMPRGTVLFSSRAPIGYISIATNEICTNQGFKSAVPGIAGTGYLYYFLQANTDKIESKASGSTFKEASGSLMKALEVIIPADGILNQFEAELAPILTKQENIASEIQTLTTLRDTLLPKLMSGELKINELDC